MTDTHESFLPAHLARLISSPGTTITAGLASAPPGTKISTVAEHIRGLADAAQAGGTTQEPSKMDKLLDKLHIKSVDKETTADGDYQHSEPDSWQSDRMRPLTAAQADEVLRAGSWGQARPSELFLNVYAQALLALDKDVLNGMVSPSLMGSSGVVPVTIISVIPDIIHHHAVLITRAESEVFLATNYWEASGAAWVLTDAMRELSRRVVARGGPPVVMKIMYDRGNPKQVVDPHQAVDVATYTAPAVKLPAPAEIPGVHLEVQNYHVPPVGTFHSKYMVVDRRIAIINSNNIQDRVNVEMMVHLEGPIVQSFYDMALMSWWSAMDPPLPLIQAPPKRTEYKFGAEHPAAQAHGDQAGQTAACMSDTNDDRTWDADNDAEALRVNSSVSTPDLLTKHLNTGSPIAATDATTSGFTPIVLLPAHDPVPIAMVNRAPRGLPGHGDTVVPQDQAWLAGFKFATKNVFIQTPTFNAKPVIAAALDAVRRGILVEIYADLGFNDEGELLPFQGGTNEMVSQHMYASLEPHERDNLRIYWYTGKDQATPLNATEKSRNCHVKLMIVDGQIAIQGNGNQDSQSWYHSQEINVLIDSPLICAQSREAIDRNQNTLAHGRVSADGIWRDANGKVLAGTKAPPNALVRPFVGVKGAIQRVRGEGGFAT